MLSEGTIVTCRCTMQIFLFFNKGEGGSVLFRSGCWKSYVDIEPDKAVVQGGGVAQQQRSSELRRLLEERVEQTGDADEAQRLPTPHSQGEVPLGDPAQRHPGAVRHHARQRVRPEPLEEVRGRMGVCGCSWVVWFLWWSCCLGALLLAVNSAFIVVFVGGLLRATVFWALTKQLQVLCHRRAHHGMGFWFPFGQQCQAHPHHTHLVSGVERRHRRVAERERRRCPATPSLSCACRGSTPAGEKPQRPSVPGKPKITSIHLEQVCNSQDSIHWWAEREKLCFVIYDPENKNEADGTWFILRKSGRLYTQLMSCFQGENATFPIC